MATEDYLNGSRRLVSVFRSPQRDGMYLYVERREGLARVPEALLALFGRPQHAMDLLLTATRPLARVDVAEVLRQLDDQGFFLQLPPVIDNEARAIIAANAKLAACRR